MDNSPLPVSIREQWPWPPRFARVNGWRMHYVDEGTGDPVVLLHPTWGSSISWRAIERSAEMAAVTEFRTFFANVFNLERVGLHEPGYVAAPSGTEYVLVFIGRSGEPFPTGVEIYALVPALEPLDEEA